MKNKLELGLMGISFAASIIGMIIVIHFTFRFLMKEWDTIIAFLAKVF